MPARPSFVDRPLIVEVAVNGARSRSEHPRVPLGETELEACILACADAGASIIHAHAGEAVVGSTGQHRADSYAAVFRSVLGRRPGLLLYPTLPGGGPGTSMRRRLEHVIALAHEGLVGLVPVDPGTMNYGSVDAAGRPPEHDAVYQTTFADVAWAFAHCREARLPCTLSVFEPGFLRLIDAHDRAGTLPREAIVKLEFSAGPRLFGLPPTAAAVDLYLSMFDSARIPWMVTLRGGDCLDDVAALAIERGGHVRIGIEDFAGPPWAGNEESVARLAGLGCAFGRPLAGAAGRQLLRDAWSASRSL